MVLPIYNTESDTCILKVLKTKDSDFQYFSNENRERKVYLFVDKISETRAFRYTDITEVKPPVFLIKNLEVVLDPSYFGSVENEANDGSVAEGTRMPSFTLSAVIYTAVVCMNSSTTV